MKNSNNKLILDLGCGNKKRDGTVGVDMNTRLKGDINHDLNKFPYPFDDNSVDYIYIDNTLEHLDSPLKVMEEIYRILKPGCGVKVIVPYFRSHSAFTDPTHTKFFTTESFTYYDPDHAIAKRYDYTLAKFKTTKIIFHRNLNKSIGWGGGLLPSPPNPPTRQDRPGDLAGAIARSSGLPHGLLELLGSQRSRSRPPPSSYPSMQL